MNKPDTTQSVEEIKKAFEEKFFMATPVNDDDVISVSVGRGVFNVASADTDGVWNFFLPYLQPNKESK